MVKVAPSILSANFACLKEDCERVLLPGNSILHFDVMDGHFVPNLTVGVPVLHSLVAALPNVFYDVHLMLTHPARFVADFAAAGADAITIHYEAESPLHQTFAAIRKAGCKVGLSLKPGTPVNEIFPFLDEVDYVLVMSVEPGFGGQAFIPESVGRIAALKQEKEKQGLDFAIEVDGGINPDTASLCVSAGADILVAGSTVFNAPSPPAMVQRLRDIG